MGTEYDLGWLVFTVVVGGTAAIYGFLKKVHKRYWSSPSFWGDLVWSIWEFFNSVVDLDTCCCHGVNSDCMEFLFSSWEERIISAKKHERKIGFYLKDIGSGKNTLAVIKKQSIVGRTSYDVCGSFARKYAPHLSPRQALKWSTRCEMIDWLSTLIKLPATEAVQEAKYTNAGNRFFKVLIGEFEDQLYIPKTYLQQYNSIKCGSMRLRNGEKEWEVEVDGRVIKNGWNKFVKDHRLCEGDFLLFSALGEMLFNVAIFGQNGRIKEFPWYHAFNPDVRVVYA